MNSGSCLGSQRSPIEGPHFQNRRSTVPFSWEKCDKVPPRVPFTLCHPCSSDKTLSPPLSFTHCLLVTKHHKSCLDESGTSKGRHKKDVQLIAEHGGCLRRSTCSRLRSQRKNLKKEETWFSREVSRGEIPQIFPDMLWKGRERVNETGSEAHRAHSLLSAASPSFPPSSLSSSGPIRLRGKSLTLNRCLSPEIMSLKLPSASAELWKYIWTPRSFERGGGRRRAGVLVVSDAEVSGKPTRSCCVSVNVTSKVTRWLKFLFPRRFVSSGVQNKT